MASNIVASTNTNMSEVDILMTMNWCMDKEKKREKMVEKMGVQDEFIRSTEESEDLAMNSKISTRMKMTIAEKSGLNNSVDSCTNRMALRTVDQIIDDNCDRLTQQLQDQMLCSSDVSCDSRSEFRHISGCCNNLQNAQYGK